MPQRLRTFGFGDIILSVVLVGCWSRRSPEVAFEDHLPSSLNRIAQWRDFTPPDGDFTVALPGEAECSIESVSSVVGRQRIVRYRLSIEGMFVDVGYLERTDHPLSRLATRAQILDAAMKGTLETYRGSTDGPAIRNDPHSRVRALDAKFEGAIAGHGRIRLELTPDRIYHAIVIRTDGAEDLGDAARVLDTFHVHEQDDGT